MSAQELYDRMTRRLHEKLHGYGKESGGIIETAVGGYPQDYPTYRDICGQVRAYRTAQEFLDQEFRDMFDVQKHDLTPEQK